MHEKLFQFISGYMELDENEKKAILDLNVFHSVKKGTILLRQGQYSQNGYFVLSGLLRKYYEKNGEEKTMAFYSELEVVTPHCVTNRLPSAYYIDCIEDAIITMGTPDMEMQMLQKFPRFEILCKLMAEDLLGKEQITLDSYKLNSPEERYLNLMNTRPDLLQRVPQHQIASFLGIKPQSFSRIKARIRKK